MKKTKLVYRILAVILVAVVATAFFTVPTAWKCIRTAHELSSISSEIMYIKDSADRAKPGYGWTTERNERYYALQAERNALYKSNDAVVHAFANANNFVRLAMLVGLFLAFLLEMASLLILLVRWKNKVVRKKKSAEA